MEFAFSKVSLLRAKRHKRLTTVILQHRTKEIKYFNIHALSRLASPGYISLLRVASTLDVLLEILEISGTAVFKNLMPGDNKKVKLKAACLFK